MDSHDTIYTTTENGAGGEVGMGGGGGGAGGIKTLSNHLNSLPVTILKS